MTKRRRLFLALVSIGAVVSLIVTVERVRIRRDVIQLLTVPTEPTLSVAFVHRYSRIDPHGGYRLEFDNRTALLVLQSSSLARSGPIPPGGFQGPIVYELRRQHT